jgi:hypothetical protein
MPTITDYAGNQLDGDGDGAGGDEYEADFTNPGRRGEFNGDGTINGLDIQTFVDVLTGLDTNPSHITWADVNNDGTADLKDVPFFMQCLLDGGC